MADPSQFPGRLAGATQVIFAVLLGGVASFGFEPGFIPLGAVLLVVFALPGVIGLIGTSARRPALLVAAGLTSFIASFVAFSGVTLIFLIPALLFLFGAGRLELGNAGSLRGGWRSGLAQLALGAAIIVLVVGAGASALLLTDSGCWSEIVSPNGVRIETAPFPTGEMAIPSGAASAGCSTGLISPRGVGLGSLLAMGALGLARVAARSADQ